MVEATPTTGITKPISELTRGDLENLNEAELEAVIAAGLDNSNDARLTLGRLLIEGTSDKIAKNEKKGYNWVKEASKNNHLGALEYRTYHEIRFDKQPNMKKLLTNLETVVEKTRSTRAFNMLGEFNQVQDKKEGSKEEAAKYYSKSADEGCQIGIHWMGVFYHLGFGVPKNLTKAVEYLTRAGKTGNSQSCYQLAILYMSEEGEFRDIKKAYIYFEKALLYGVSFFEEFHALFIANFAELSPIFLTTKKPSAMIDKDNKEEVIKLHEAFVNEIKTSFSGALGKDRLYQRPVGFMQDQQIWMIGVLVRYFVKKVLSFDHADFMKALKEDINPLLGDLGLWALHNYSITQKEKGKADKRKRAQIAIEIVKSYLEHGFDLIGQEKKYHFMNKFSPKKLPQEHIKRESLPFIYSWMHYAPQQWFEHIKKLEDEAKMSEERKKNVNLVKKCSFCGAPESDLRKHKVCSACKQAFYCTGDCQKYDWQKKHKNECKEL